MLNLSVTDVNGIQIASLQAPQKNFKTGSRGFGVCQKVYIDGKKYQALINIVECGSKGASKGAIEE